MKKSVALLIVMFGLFASSKIFANNWLEMPLSKPGQWEQLSFREIPANEVAFIDGTMIIDVNQSSSPVIYPLDQPVNIDEITLNLEVDGRLNLGEQQQGETGADDFVFRLGVVYSGQQQLTGFQKIMAPDWVKRLYQLAPDATGVERIHFFNVYSDDRLANGLRTHPLSELITEQFLFKRSFQPHVLRFKPRDNKKVIALWISSDGDDTDSSYRVTLKDLILTARE
ncbi:hypothetical protein GZ77_23415 [Endozoicomonas montiporae]|uniref:Uncharacterized protein n=2 Tax=Endozoicomonas montiporae TaxID=1027273 RepID=A0A081N0R2_9GAMM|nr:hypothetical protein [Endozoicomonas montiporae]AMO54514.1 hypothetical protein EZMO1_0249 [Endozoicomonas montiporae CL-33]KEQ12035.1 hypothetical protein GZ77_23415 [Endozoicomonas montiporae]